MRSSSLSPARARRGRGRGAGPARARGARLAGRRRVPRPDGAPHRGAVGRRRGLPRDRPSSRRPDRRRRARRADPALERDRGADPGRPAGRREPARSRRAAAQGHRPAGARLPARRRRACPGVPAACGPRRRSGAGRRGRASPSRRSSRSSRRSPRVVLGTRGGSGPASARPPVSADSVGIFDAADGRLSGQIPVGASPSAVTAGDGSIWVANVDAHSVSRIDPVKRDGDRDDPGRERARRDRLRRRLRLGDERPRRHGHEDRPDRRTPSSTRSRSATARPASPSTPATSGSRTRTTARSRGSTSRRTSRSPPIPVGQSADGVAIGDGSVWVTSQAAGTRDADRRAHRGRRSSRSRPGAAPTRSRSRAGAVWVANSLAGTVTRIDPARTASAPSIPVGDGPNGDRGRRRRVWVSNELAGTLTRIDPATNTPAPDRRRPATVPRGSRLDSRSLFVAVRASGAGHRGGTLTVLDSPAISTASTRPSRTSRRSSSCSIDHERRAHRLPAHGRRRRHPARAGPRGLDSRARPTAAAPTRFQLRPGIRYSTGAIVQPADFRRAHRTVARRSQAAQRAATTPTSSAQPPASPRRRSRATSRGGS